MIFVRTPYNYDRNKASDESGIACKDPSKAQQHFKEEADINYIVKRFRITGKLPENVRLPVSADFDQITDFQTAMNVIRQGEESFAQMPANVRARFSNDPAKFVDFCLDPENLPEAKKLGLAVPESPQPPPATGGATPVAPGATTPASAQPNTPKGDV